MKVTLYVNGREQARDVEPRLLLIHFIRDELGLTGSHWGCDTSNCGACVMWLDEVPVKSCTVLAVMADGRRVTTVEGLARGGTARGARLDPVQQGFAACHGLQCGFCTPGMMMTARWLLGPHIQRRRKRTSARRSPARSAGAPATRTSSGQSCGQPSSRRRIGSERLRVASAQGRRAPDPRPGHVHRRHHLPGMLHGAILRSPGACPDHRRGRDGGACPSQGRRRETH